MAAFFFPPSFFAELYHVIPEFFSLLYRGLCID